MPVFNPYKYRVAFIRLYFCMEFCMKAIIVPTDFSPAALSAVNYAADFALAINAPLVLLHVYQVPIAVTETSTVLIPAEELEEDAERKLAGLANDLKHISSRKLQLSTEARLGDVTDELELCCQKFDPLCIVMGTTGHSAFERTVFGSTTLSVIRHSSYPVLVVPKGTEFGTGIKKSALAWDLSKNTDGLPAAAINELLSVTGSSLAVVHVGKNDPASAPVVSSPLSGSVSADAGPHAGNEKGLLGSFSTTGVSVHHVVADSVSAGISSFAIENNMDLVITVPHQHGFFESLFSRSATEGLIEISRIPVLCFHAK
ncbi:MAG: universal stress protein [Chitinophagaceae bacterium]|nr:MAG: universal stress protein [Chitinophagaceae bacterium]